MGPVETEISSARQKKPSFGQSVSLQNEKIFIPTHIGSLNYIVNAFYLTFVLIFFTSICSGDS